MAHRSTQQKRALGMAFSAYPRGARVIHIKPRGSA